MKTSPWASPGLIAFLRTYVDHDQARSVRSALAGASGITLLEGGSWTGKTRTILTLARRLNDRRPANETSALPGLVCDLPFGHRPRETSDMVLYALKGHRGGLPDLTTKQSHAKAVSALDRAGIRLLAFEAGDWREVHPTIREGILALAEARPEPTVVIGRGFEADPTLSGANRMTMRAYEADEPGFVGFVRGMVESMPGIDPSSLGRSGDTARIHAATGGAIGPVADLLRDALAAAVEDGADTILDRHLALAHARLAGRRSTTFHLLENPWS